MPQYFFKFPKILKDKKILTDLTTRTKIRDRFIDNDDLYYFYDYQEGDTPEILASKYYGSPELHWIILITNNIFDHNFDCPMPYIVFKKYIEDKYKNNYGVSSLRTINGGINYPDGVYEKIPLTIKNSSDLNSVGSGINVTLTFTDGSLEGNPEIHRGGHKYDANTIFTVDSKYTGGYGQGLELGISGFMTGMEYAQSTIHPEFGYKKEIRVFDFSREDYEISSANNKLIVTSTPYVVLSRTFYQLDEESYYSLYEGADPHPAEIISTEVDGQIAYDSIRVPPITIFDYEQQLNESKRKIRILKKEYYDRVLREFVNLMSLTYA